MAKQYHTLLSREPGGRWGIAFGDYSRKTVSDELGDMFEDDARNLGNTEFRIITTGDAQSDIQAAVDALNGVVKAGPIARHVMRTIRECAGDSACLGWPEEFERAENTYQVDVAIYVGADHFAVMRSALRDRGRALPLAAFRAERAEHEAWLSGDPAYPSMVAARMSARPFDGPLSTGFAEPQPVRAGTIAGHVIHKIRGARNDDELRDREGCIQASIARRVGANELETIRMAILDRCARAGA